METTQIPEWISELSNDNLLAIYDVSLDIRDELQIHDDVVIPLYRQFVRFAPMCPANSVGLIDRYCDLRWKAAILLKRRGVIEDFKLLKGLHRWDSNLEFHLSPETFNQHFIAIEHVFQTRYKNDDAKQGSLSQASTKEPIEILRAILLRFHAVVMQLRERYADRPTLDVNDEYDVQNLLHALLYLHFDDIRPEEWTPSYAGKSSRVDFLLKLEQIVIEVKKTRLGLSTKEIGDQLIIDKERYSKMDECKTLVCFIYDPENRITNAAGLESDLAEDRDDFKVKVIVVPKQY